MPIATSRSPPTREPCLPTTSTRRPGRPPARARIDYAFHMIFGESSIASIKEELPGLMQEGYLSVKVFMNYPGFMLDDERILDVMDTTRRHGGLTMVHAENGHCEIGRAHV